MSKSKRFGVMLSLRNMLIIGALALMSCSVAAVTVIGYTKINERLKDDISLATDWSLRVAVHMMTSTLSIFTLENNAAGEPERLKLNLPISILDTQSEHELNRLVDGISAINKGTATFFRWDAAKQDFVRVATTVKNAEGKRATGTVLGKESAAYAFMMRRETYRGIATILGNPWQTAYLPIIDQNNQAVGILFVGVGKIADLRNTEAHFFNEVLIGSGLVMLVAAFAVFFITRRLLMPLDQLASATDALAQGREVDVPHQNRGDQIGLIAKAVDRFKLAVQAQREHEARGIDDARRLAERKVAMDEMVEAFRAQMKTNLGELRTGADRVQQTSGTIRAVVGAAKARAEDGQLAADRGSLAVTEVATSTNQFAGSIAEIASRSNEAATVVRSAAESGERAGQVAGELSSVVERISSAVGVISSIAAQTNLLALNATIEAARAGEAGKGFAVVASEVKELSGGTSRAATEIAELVKSIEGVTQSVTSATADIAQGLGVINETTMAIASAVTEQEQVTQTIAANAESAAQGSQSVQQGLAQILSAIDNTAAAADDLDALSQRFSASSDALIRDVENFLARMAA